MEREIERGGKAEAPLYLLCQHMHSTLYPLSLSHHHKIHFGPGKKNLRVVKKKCS
jgi:hypothetical protein